MKRALLAAGLAGACAAGTAWAFNREKAAEWGGAATGAAVQAWDGVAANPGPALLALATFAATVAYHKVRGRSLRQALELAATRFQVVTLPAEPDAGEPAVLRRAKARATRAQLLSDQVGLEARLKKLPPAINAAEQDVGFAERAVADAERALDRKQAALAAAVQGRDGLRAEYAAGRADLAAIEAELTKLAEAA